MKAKKKRNIINSQGDRGQKFSVSEIKDLTIDYEQIYAMKFDNSHKMKKFLENMQLKTN